MSDYRLEFGGHGVSYKGTVLILSPAPCDKLLAHLQMKERSRNQWLPIETARKDGTMIIAHDWHRGCGIYGHDETHIVSFRDGEWFGKDSYEPHYPTHWRPLPGPPGA